MDHRCPHRCASLFFGRNEDGGIRCVYHGWKFDVHGNCLEMPNVAPEQDFGHKVKAKAYKAVERGGVIWVYMGARAEAPPMPMIEATLLAEGDLSITFAQRECNWMQALEGDIDTSHFGFLHIGSRATRAGRSETTWLKYQVTNRAPDYHVTDTDWGTMYCAYRPAEDSPDLLALCAFRLPVLDIQVPQGDFIDRVIARAWVPMDDTHVMFVRLTWKQVSRTSALAGGKAIPGSTPAPELQPNTTDWYGRWRPVQNAANDYLIDRDAQRNNVIYTGITHIAMQDQAITESMGDDCRPLVRASGAERSDDHAHAAKAPDRGAGIAGEECGAAVRESA